MLAPSVAFVDLETTGADPAHDRITEIGIVKVTQGRFDYQWSTLVNPETPIPPAIQRFTGITDEMVAAAPRFAELADEILSRLEGSLFVAHNARFDVGFLRGAFRRLGIGFQPEVLCTVRLSRALYPHERRHGLDALIERHALACEARHRALGDAQVLWDFVQLAESAHDRATLDAAIARAMRSARLPAAIDPALIDEVPEAPGAFMLLGEAERPLHAGHGTNLRTAVTAAFSSGHGRGKRLQEARDIRWQRSAGEFGARLLAIGFSRQVSRPIEPACLLRVCDRADGTAAVAVLPLAQARPADVEGAFGVFRNRREALNRLRDLMPDYGLCARRLGLEEGAGRCAAHRAGTCRGVCMGTEPSAWHDARLRGALAGRAIATWPYPGPIGIREQDPWHERTEIHVFDRWCHLGRADAPEGLAACLEAGGAARFDAEIYRLLLKTLEPAARRGAVIDLSSVDYGATGWNALDT